MYKCIYEEENKKNKQFTYTARRWTDIALVIIIIMIIINKDFITIIIIAITDRLPIVINIVLIIAFAWTFKDYLNRPPVINTMAVVVEVVAVAAIIKDSTC